MKTKMKALALALCAVLLVASTVFVTVAYLTSTTKTVKNTFTVGQVAIILNEAKVEQYGDPVDANGEVITDKMTITDAEGNTKEVLDYTKAPRVLENTYKLIPGLDYVKDPTVQVKTDSEDCFVRMMVTVTVPAAAASQIPTDLANIITGHDENIWVRKNQTVTPGADATAPTVIVYEYRYNGIVDASTLPAGYEADYGKLPALFTGITIPGDMEVADLAGLKINVVAHAIQAAGFDGDVDKAWTAFDDDAKNTGDAFNNNGTQN